MHFLLGIVFLIGVGSTRVQAQEDPSPLAGKVVHVYNPFGKSLPLINLSGVGYPMTAESGNWHRFAFDSIGGNLAPWMVDFGVRTGDWQWLTPTGLGTATGAFGAGVFGASNEVWIIVDPAGPATAPPLLLITPPRTVHIFNPWPVSGVDFILNGARRSMMPDRSHCGWNVTHILNDGPAAGYFASSGDPETWGKGGLGDNTPFDFTALFAEHGPDIWIGSSSNITKTFPGETGSCTYLMAMTVHDMAEGHPNFGSGGGPGTVLRDLGPNKKPAGGAGAPSHFNSWFISDTAAAAPLKRAETCLDLEMGRSDDGLWEFDSNNGATSNEFFPIDDFNLLDRNTSCSSGPAPPESTIHNYGFCMESHASFVYKRGQVFEFRGDDDVFVFINNRLALDLGGIHPALDGKIDLDTLGLVEGQSYPWDFFFCERNKCGSSLRIKTTIYFRQQRALDHAEEKLPAGGTRYRIIKRIGGTGACGSSGDSITEVPPGPLTFVLYRAGDSIQVLPKGTSFGGIELADGFATVDTSKVTGLAPGTYRIVFYETSNPKLRDEFQFTVSARNIVLFENPLAQTAVLGEPIRVVAGNRYQAGGKDSLVAGTVTWNATFPANLMVYEDSMRTVRVSPGGTLSTAPTGQDTLWVFGDPAATADQNHTLSIPGSNKATVTFSLPALDLPKAVSAGIYDDDGDGRGDRLQIVYDRNITGNLPASIAYQWPASAAAVSASDLTGRLRGGGTLVFQGSPLSPEILTQGSGIFKSTYTARGKDSTQTLAVSDRIAPVITGAEIRLGSASDTLRLAFSEPLAAGSRSAPARDLFTYKMADNGTSASIAPSRTDWAADGLSVQLVFDSASEPRPKAGDSVRLNGGSGLAADASGNAPGHESRFRLITGEKRIAIQTLTFSRFTAAPALVAAPVFAPTLQGGRDNIQDAVTGTGRLGALLEADLGDFAVGDGFTAPPPSSVRLEYEFAIFTNHGLPVATGKRSLACTDDVYKGDCRSNKGRLFVGWNYASNNHEKVATGAYVVQFNYRIVAQGKVMAANGIRQVWGLLRAD